MDHEHVYALTSKGNAELKSASTSLTAPELALLVLVDGRASVAQIARTARPLTPEVVAETLVKLVASGHIVAAAGAIDVRDFFSESDAGLASLRANGYFVRIARRAAPRAKLAEGQKLAVLVIEDDAQLANLLSTYLQLEDFAVRIAANRDEINAALRESPKPDVVILDVVLPDIDGFDVLSCMRLDDAVKSVPVIMATAKATREAVLTGLLRGADGYVTKPYHMQVLLKAVKTVLGMPRGAGGSWSDDA